MHPGITFFLIWLFGGARRGRGRSGDLGGTDKQHMSDKPPFIQCGETYRTWQ